MGRKENPIKWKDKKKGLIATTGAARIFFFTFNAYRHEGMTDEEIWKMMLSPKKHKEDIRKNIQIKDWLYDNDIEFVGVNDVHFDFEEPKEVHDEFIFRKKVVSC